MLQMQVPAFTFIRRNKGISSMNNAPDSCISSLLRNQWPTPSHSQHHKYTVYKTAAETVDT